MSETTDAGQERLISALSDFDTRFARGELSVDVLRSVVHKPRTLHNRTDKTCDETGQYFGWLGRHQLQALL